MSETGNPAGVTDPAEVDTSLSQQTGGTGLCPGPVVFPMATGADADKWAQEFGYPLEAETGNISVGGLMDELAAHDEAGRFMLEVYDHIVAAKGGEGSETAAAFLTNFMPPNPQTGDKRRFYCKLVFGEETVLSVVSSGYSASSSIHIYQNGVPTSHVDPLFNILGSEIIIPVSPKETISTRAGFYNNSSSKTITSAQAAAAVISNVENTNKFKPYIDWLIFGTGVVLTVYGVGATVGLIRVAATTGARLLASTALVFEIADGTEYISGYIGGTKTGYNPLKSAFRSVGKSANGASGAQTAEYIYNTLNIGVGFGGKIGLFGGSLYAVTQMPTACQPVEGAATEQPLPSQGEAQKTVF